MLSTRVFGLACAVTVFVCLVAAPVSTQPLDERTRSSSLSIATPSIPVIGSAPASVQTRATGGTVLSFSSTRAGSTRAARTPLPRTASQLPLLAMVCTLSLLSAASLGFWRPR